MTITAKMGQYDIVPTYEFDTESQLIADTLSTETEVKIKQRITDLQAEILSMELTETGAEMAKQIQRLNFLQGKIATFKELLSDSEEAKTKQFIGQ